MNKILIIIEREFLKRIQKKSFIVLTIVSPLIMAALIFVPLWLSSIENDEQQHVAVWCQVSITRCVARNLPTTPW